MTPELPYAGTEGFVARPASEERARRNATDGTSRDRQRQVLHYLRYRPDGLTWVELGGALQLHHGQISSTLSVLHKSGQLFQLRVKRGRSHPYVHADHRDLYSAIERYDEPTRTNAGQIQERLDAAILLLVVALDECESNPFSHQYEARLIGEALTVLRGEVA